MIPWKVLRTLMFELCNAVNSKDLVSTFSIVDKNEMVRAIQAVETRTVSAATQYLSKAINECAWPAYLMRDYTYSKDMPKTKHTETTLDLISRAAKT